MDQQRVLARGPELQQLHSALRVVEQQKGVRATEFQSTGTAGEAVTLAERLADIERRYGADHVVTRSVHQARPELERCIYQVEAGLRSAAAP